MAFPRLHQRALPPAEHGAPSLRVVTVSAVLWMTAVPTGVGRSSLWF